MTDETPPALLDPHSHPPPLPRIVVMRKATSSVMKTSAKKAPALKKWPLSIEEFPSCEANNKETVYFLRKLRQGVVQRFSNCFPLPPVADIRAESQDTHNYYKPAVDSRTFDHEGMKPSIPKTQTASHLLLVKTQQCLIGNIDRLICLLDNRKEISESTSNSQLDRYLHRKDRRPLTTRCFEVLKILFPKRVCRITPSYINNASGRPTHGWFEVVMRCLISIMLWGIGGLLVWSFRKETNNI
jgi:hypothetical protein